MPAMTTVNVLMYSVQVGVVVVVGLTAWRLLGLTRVRLCYAYLNALLLGCLLLPLAPPLPASPASFSLSAVAAPTPGAAQPGTPRAVAPLFESRGSLPEIDRAVGTVLVIGGLARLGWLAAGLVTLRRLRRRSTPAEPLVPSVVRAAGLVRVRADLRVSASVSRPVTFGVFRPIVLLPPFFGDLREDEQVGVITHELLHVRRRDWVHVLAEELARAVLWFHPAVWWLLDRISIAREQLVDREVVALTNGRRAYLDALLKVARAEMIVPRFPAAAMLRESQLGERVRLLLEEVVMSPKRMCFSLLVTGALIAASGVLVVQAFPLAPQAPAPSAGPGQAPRPGMQPPAVPDAQDEPHIANVLHRVAPQATLDNLSALVIVEAEVGADGRVTQATGVGGDALLFGSATDAVRQWVFEAVDAPHRAVIGMNIGVTSQEGVDSPNPLRVGGVIQPPKKTKHVAPEYPSDAKDAHVQGIVIVEALVGPSGRVRDARVVKSVPGLDHAALLSVLQWEFQPVLMNGAPKSAMMTVTINFTLQ